MLDTRTDRSRRDHERTDQAASRGGIGSCRCRGGAWHNRDRRGVGPALGRGRICRRRCAGAGLLFCEDFETLPVGPASSPNWSVDTSGGSLTVASDQDSAANQVLRVNTTDNGRAFLSVDDFAAPGNSFFGRMRLRVAKFPTAPDFAHFVITEITGTGSTEIVRPVGGQFIPSAGTSEFGIGADGGPTGDWTDHRDSAPTTDDTWQCVQWVVAAQDNRLALTIDGVENPDLAVSTDQHGGNPVPFVLPTVNRVKIGWQVFQGGTTPGQFDVEIDDIALSTQRLAC